MDRNQELATNLRQWRDDQKRMLADSIERLERLSGFSRNYQRNAAHPNTDPYLAGIERERSSIDELTSTITSTEHLIGLAEGGELANPNS